MTNPQEPKSSEDSNVPDWTGVAFPVVTPANAPVPQPEPTPDQVQAHARALLRSVPDRVWDERRRGMNPHRFVL